MTRNKKTKLEKELEKFVLIQHKKYMKIQKEHEKEISYIG